MAAGDWTGGWLGSSVIVVNGGGTGPPAPRPLPVPSPIPAWSPEYVDHVAIGLSRLVQQFQSSGDE